MISKTLVIHKGPTAAIHIHTLASHAISTAPMNSLHSKGLSAHRHALNVPE